MISCQSRSVARAWSYIDFFKQIVFKHTNVKIYKMSIVFLRGKSISTPSPPWPLLLSSQVIFRTIQLDWLHSLWRAAQLLILHAETPLSLSCARKAGHMLHHKAIEQADKCPSTHFARCLWLMMLKALLRGRWNPNKVKESFFICVSKHPERLRRQGHPDSVKLKKFQRLLRKKGLPI